MQGTLPDYPLVYAETPCVRLAIVYNPFDLSAIAKHELEYGQSKTLADYMVGLPDEVEWNVAYNGELVEKTDWATTTPAPFSNITIVRIPEGGGGDKGKTILRVVALIAVMTFAQWAGPLLVSAMGVTGAATATTAATVGFTLAANAATAAIGVAGSMAVNALLGPKAPEQDKLSTAYGLDGAKNSAREGVVVPVVYGDFRIGGNVCDLFTRNFGEDQYLYIRTVLNDGEVEDITDIEVNGQPISSFNDVQTRIRLGKPTEEPNDWFDETVRQFNRGSVITTDWTQHVTDDPVDRLRADVLFPQGLYFAKDDGRKIAATVQLQLQYCGVDANGQPNGNWQDMPLRGSTAVAPGSTSTTLPNSEVATLQVQTQANAAGDGYTLKGQYRKVGTQDWIDAAEVKGKPSIQNIIGAITNGGEIVWPTVPYTFQFPEVATYEIRVEGGLVEGVQVASVISAPSLTVTDSSSRTKRLTYESANLPPARYAMRIRRAAPDDQEDKRTDECWISDFGEIENEPTNVNGIANLSMRIKMTDQLNGIPTVTALVKGSKVKIYDEDGNVVDFRKSANPADIVADILHNRLRGAGYNPNKMVWPRYVEFREHCEQEDYEFNAVFDTVESAWDVAQTVAARGHGTLIPRGTKFSFTIDRAATPEMVFTPSNIYRDSFKTTWVGTQERANEIHLAFADKANGYKQRTIRITDNEAFARGERQKIASASGMGIVDAAEAVREAEFAARTNRYIKKKIEFDAPLEAIGLGLGDVALIQHDTMDFKGGVGGRLKAGSTATAINLDRPVSMEAGKDYMLLVVESALKRANCTITNISGSRITLSGLGDEMPRVRRLIQSGHDVEVLALTKVGSAWRATVSDGDNLETGSCELWDTDVIEERDVVVAAGESESITLASPLSKAPTQFANFMFGPKVSVKQPFRLKSISGNDVDRRTLGFVQYDGRVYERGGFEVDDVPTPVSDTLGHVTMLMADYDRQPLPDQDRIAVNLTWQHNSSKYGGADIYTKTGPDGVWIFLTTVTNGMAVSRDFSRGDTIQVKAVAFDNRGTRARFHDAPETVLSLAVFDMTLEAPENVTYSVPTFRVDATAQIAWDAPSDALAQRYRVETKRIEFAEWEDAVNGSWDDSPSAQDPNGWDSQFTPTTNVTVPRLDLGYYVVRIRSERGFAVSAWTHLPVEVAAPALPNRVTGLRLNMGSPDPLTDTFHGRDAKFIWNDVSASASGIGAEEGADLEGMDHYFRDYLVQIRTPEGQLIREEAVRDANYTYTIEKNREDHVGSTQFLARRQFKIEVRIRGRQGQISNAATMSVNNPAPAVPALQSVLPGVDGFVLNLERVADNDAVGTILWVSETNGFTPSNANKVFDGPGLVQWKGEPRKTYYFRYAAYDAFGTDLLNVSGQQSTATTGLNNSYFDPSFYDGVIPADVMNRIALVDGDGPGSVNARVAGVNSRVTQEVAGLNSRIDTVTSTAGNRIFYGSTTPVAGALNDVWINPNDNNRIKRWDGDSWEYSDDNRISSLTGTVSDLAETVADNDSAMSQRVNSVESNAASRNRTFRQATAPTNPQGGYALTLGDIWYDTANGNKVYRWAGGATMWQETSDGRIEQTSARVGLLETAVSSPTGSVAVRIGEVSAIANARNRTYRQATAPAAPVAGDLWIDTSLVAGVPGNVLKRWTGSVWEETSDSRIAANAALVQNHEYALANENGALATGLNAVRAQALARNRTWYQAAAPANNPQNALAIGDLWLDSDDNNRSYRWSGTAWVEVTDPRTALNTADVSLLKTAVTDPNGSVATQINTVQAIANSRNRTFRQTTAPSGAVLGDIWIDTTLVSGVEGNVMKRYNGAAWIATGDSRIAESLARLSVAEQAISDNNTAMGQRVSTVETSVAARCRTFAQNSQPSNPAGGYVLAVGDMWYDTDDNNRAYRWNGSSWVEVTDPRTETNSAKVQQLEYAYSNPNGSIAQRFGTVEATAAARNRTFLQDTTPTANAVGDIWINPASNNRMWRWNGSAWVEVTDTRTGDNVSRVTNLEYAVTNENGSVAQRINAVSSQFNGFTSSVSTLSQAIDGIKAEWGIQVNNNGAISGIALTSTLMANGAFSTFKVEADRIEFCAPGAGSGIQPFVYDSANSRIIAQNMLLRGQLEVQSAPNGMRTVMTNSGVNVYDANGTLRVRLGIW